MDWDSIDSIRRAGFQGFCHVRDLWASGCKEVPGAAGIYLVLRDSTEAPQFASSSCGGHFKQRDPTVSQDTLAADWVNDAVVVYIGQAGGSGSRSTLRKRIGSYMRFGAGRPVGHWGGRYVWQLQDPGSLIVCWKVAGGSDAAELETELIRDFSERFGRRPFANLRD